MKKIICFLIPILTFGLFSCSEINHKKKSENNSSFDKDKTKLINTFNDFPEKITEYDYAEKTLDLNIFLGVNHINNEYAKKINSLIEMDTWVQNGGFSAYWYITDFSHSEGKNSELKDIKFLNNFLIELKLHDITEFVTINNNYYIKYYGTEFPDHVIQEMDELYSHYIKNNIQIQKALYEYCKNNLNKILGELD